MSGMKSWLARRTPAEWLAALLAAAFLLTFGWALYFQIVPQVDAAHYESISSNIAAGNGYRMVAGTPLASDDAIASVGPLYEFFLALLLRVFHFQLAFVWLAQALLDVATGFLLFLTARRAFGKADGEYMGLIAAGLYLFFIDIVQMPAMLMTETLYLFLIAFTTYLFVRLYQEPGYANAALLGVAGAFAVLTRPTALLMLILVFIAALALRRYKQAAALLFCSVLVIAPWTLRNYSVYHSFILTTAAGGYDLWMGNNAGADGGAHPTREIVAYAASHTFTQTAAYGDAQFKQFIFGHPLAETKLLAEKTIAYASVARPYAFWFYLSGLAQKIVLVWSAAWSFILFSLGLAGAWLLWESKQPLYRWLLALAVLMPASVIPIIVETRYRLPLYPFLALFAGYFAVRLYRDRSLSKVLGVAAAFIFVDAAVDGASHLGLILDRLGL